MNQALVLILSIFQFSNSYALELNKENQAVSLGLAQTYLYNDFADHSRNSFTPTLSYRYFRDQKFFAQAELHYFKEDFGREDFSSKSLNFAIGHHFWSLDNLSLGFNGGFGFYGPRATRLSGTSYKETESKIVFGTTLGLNTLMKLNPKYAISFQYQYHNPFDVAQQDSSSDLEGHYTLISINLLYYFMVK